ncbi:MAG: exosortase/archaeosortase family protein [Prevotellaceae bacterium]|jgi:exosortase/archaeosortase family protein|nr:exosortase/archaeosortase family protein [Prevotellaceae bacterium]
MKFPQKLEPYKGVIYFILILLLSHFFWKIVVRGDESDSNVMFFGLDISAPFVWLSQHIAYLTANILNFFGQHVKLEAYNIIRHTEGHAIRIVWACSGLKQAYIFFCIIAFYRGSGLKKLWYIPLGLIVVYLFNLFRIVFITGFIKYYPSSFDFLHEYLFKYLFYGVIFLMWVLWEEKFAVKKNKKAASETIHEHKN